MSDYLARYQGQFKGVLHWPQLDKLWQEIRNRSEQGWYLYDVGKTPPEVAAGDQELVEFIAQIDRLLRELHEEEYCGIVYADDFERPTLIKIFHPKRLGASCGSSGDTILPAWTLSVMQPVDLLDWKAEKERKPAWWRRVVSGMR